MKSISNIKNIKMKKIIHTDKAPKALGPYSQAVEANGTLYISGQVPINPATNKVVEGEAESKFEFPSADRWSV